MSYFHEFIKMLNESEVNGTVREMIERLAEILDEQQERIKKLEEKLEI